MRLFQLIDKRTGEVVFEGSEASRSNPCWVCGDRHAVQSWCLLDKTREVAICPRVEGARRIGDAGWWHGPKDAPGAFVASKSFGDQYPSIDWEMRWKAARTATTRADTAVLARQLGLDAAAIESAVEIGVERDRSSAPTFVFAMRGIEGRVCGLKLRLPDGRKLCARGSRLGLIHARTFDKRKSSLVVTEGESDLMVAAMLGQNAVARPGCKSCVALVSDLARGKDLMVIADRDEAGLAGARALVAAVKTRSRLARVLVTDKKDLREWFCAGGDAQKLNWMLQSVRGY